MTHQVQESIRLDFDAQALSVANPLRTVTESDENLPIARSAPKLSVAEVAQALLELTKPRIAVMVSLVAAAGYYLGADNGSFSYQRLIEMLIGVALLSMGVGTLNQYMERDLDRRMKRTTLRPLPARKLLTTTALLFGVGLVTFAEGYLWWRVNPPSALLGLIVIVGYLLCYTPLKTRTWWSTFVGAIPGAMPPLVGWAAAQGRLAPGAWMLFGVLFLWQFPHFFAIAWMYRDDYREGGICVLPTIDPSGKRTARQIEIYSVLLVLAGIVPYLIGMAGLLYGVSAALLGTVLLYSGLRAARRIRTAHGGEVSAQIARQAARQLLLTSVIYLPLLLGAMVIDKKINQTAQTVRSHTLSATTAHRS